MFFIGHHVLFVFCLTHVSRFVACVFETIFLLAQDFLKEMEVLALSFLLCARFATAHVTECLPERFLSFEIAETLRLPSFDEVLVY